MAEIVLRNGARNHADVREHGLVSKGEKGSEFGVNEGDESIGWLLEGGGIGRASDKTGKECVAFGRAAGEQGGIPDGTENIEPGRARNQKAEAIEGMANVGFAIAEGDDADASVFDGGELRFEGGIEMREKLRSNIARDGENEALGFDRLFATRRPDGNAKARRFGFGVVIHGRDRSDVAIAAEMVTEFFGESVG